MTGKPEEDRQKKKALTEDKQPAKQIEEIARLASSVESNKDPEKVRKIKG